MVSGEKRNCEEENALEKTTTILLDIEGTTTSISFVKDVLFPYVRENLNNYVNEHWDDEEFKADLKALKLQAKKDEEEKVENFCPIEEGDNEKETLIKNILWQMDLDRKTTALKQLQGHIWREGYENGKLKGHIYGEVAPILKKWSEEGRKLYIYSSGSVEAQKLLFKNSESGDLSGFISGYFDTEIGPKTEASSYSNIVKAVGCDAGQILFFTDVVKEAVAADKAGIQVMIVLREGNAPLSDDEKKAFSTVSSFKDVVFESSNKKKKISEEEAVRSQCEKTENADEKMDESNEIKNGEPEKMETEPTEPKTEDCNEENKTEENGQSKIESDAAMETIEGESDNIDVDIDDSNAENSGGEKIVSSSGMEEGENATVETAEETEKPSEENEEEKTTAMAAEAEAPAVEEGKEENADSTSENPTPAGNEVEEEKPTEEVVEEEDEEEEEEEEKAVEEAEKEKSVNGHENGETAKENDGKESTEEANGEANGKVEEEMEAVPVKKVNTDDQADSTVEVTA